MSSLFLRAALAVSGLVASSAGAENPYRATNWDAPFEPLAQYSNATASATVALSDPADGSTPEIAIGFPFAFAGRTAETVVVSARGVVLLGSGNVPTGANTGFEAPGPDIIAPFWDELNASADPLVQTATFGAEPNRIFALEMRALSRGGSERGSWQLWLYEGEAGRFDVAFSGDFAADSSASVGYRAAAGQAAFLRCSPECNREALLGSVGRRFSAFVPAPVELRTHFEQTPENLEAGQNARASFKLRNYGTETSTPAHYALYLSSDASWDPQSDPRLHAGEVAPLGPDTELVTELDLAIPAGTAPGSYRLFLQVSPQRERIREDNRAASGPLPLGPDLVLGAIRVAGVQADGQLQVDATVRQRGLATPSEVELKFFASRDRTLDAADVELGSRRVTLSAEETGADFRTAVALAPGRYFVIGVLDPADALPEVDNDNNSLAAADSFEVGFDFVLNALTHPNFVAPGQTFPVSVEVVSAGTPAAGPVSIQVFLSSDEVLDMSDLQIGQLEAIFAGQERLTVPSEFMVDASVPGATYTLLFKVDASERWPESNEANNVAVSRTRVTNGYEFTATNLAAPVTADALDRIEFSARVESTGVPYEGKLAYEIWLSADELLGGDDLRVAEGQLAMTGLSTVPFTTQFELPVEALPGTQRWILALNPGAAVMEIDASNNVIVVPAPVAIEGAELVAESVSAPEMGFLGREIPLVVTIRNSGTRPARDFRYSVRLSENRTVRLSDPELYRSPTLEIAAGATSELRPSVLMPALTSTAVRYLGIVVDIEDRVPERTERNNLVTVPHPIGLVFPIPDLRAELIRTPTVASAGDTIDVARYLANVGVADAPVFEYRYTLRPSGGTSPARMLAPAQLALAEGQDNFRIDAVALPEDLDDGVYLLGLTVNPAGLVDEITTENNRAEEVELQIYSADIRFVTRTLPLATLGVPYEAGLAATGAPLDVTWALAAGALPAGLRLDPTGLLTGTPTEEGLFPLQVIARSGTATGRATLELRVVPPTIPLRVVTLNLPLASEGHPFSSRLDAVGGVEPYRWSIAGVLPPGIVLSPQGEFSGTATASGDFGFLAEVVDGIGGSARQMLHLKVDGPDQTLSIQPRFMAAARLGEEYCEPNPVSLEVRGGLPPYRWNQVDNPVPGLELSAEGALCGRPARVGSFGFRVRVEDADGRTDSALFYLEVVSDKTLIITTAALPDGNEGSSYAQALTADGGAPPYAWQVVDRALPKGLSLNTAGTLTGTPAEGGRFAFTLEVIDGEQRTALRPYALTITGLAKDKSDDGGCGCETSGAGNRTTSVVLLALLGFGLWVRRPRRQLPLLVLALCAIPYRAEAQAGSSSAREYVRRETPRTYQALAGATELIQGDSDDETAFFRLPFPVHFFDRTFDEVTVSVNGVVMMGRVSGVAYTPAAPGVAAAPNAWIAPLWTDLIFTPDGHLVYQVVGEAPARKVIFEWVNAHRLGQGAGPAANFQLALSEGPSGTIGIQYSGDVAFSRSTGLAIEDSTGTQKVLIHPSGCQLDCSGTVADLAGREIEFTMDAGPDLRAIGIALPRLAFSGALATMNVQVLNAHQVALGPFTFEIQLSARAPADAPRTTIFRSEPRSVEPYRTATWQVEAAVPADLAAGSYQVELVVDPAGAIDEVEEGNNRFTAPAPLLVAAGAADLAIKSLEVRSTSFAAGQELVLFARFENRGGASARGTGTFGISRNPVFSAEDTALGRFEIDLEPRGGAEIELRAPLPAELRGGTYYVGMMLDPERQVAENDEGNNSRVYPEAFALPGDEATFVQSVLPLARIGQIYDVALTVVGPPGPYRYQVAEGTLPQGFALESESGHLVGRPLRVESQTFRVEAISGEARASQSYTLRVTDPELPLTIVTRRLPIALVEREYEFGLDAAGGGAEGGYRWTGEGLPEGLSLSENGLITGVPERIGTSSVTVRLSFGDEQRERQLTIEVRPNAGLRIDGAPLPSATLGQPYEAVLLASGGVRPLTWIAGPQTRLPNGVRLDPVRGALVGTPAEVGRFSLEVTVRDSNAGAPALDQALFVLEVEDAPGFVIETETLPDAVRGEAYSALIKAVGGEGTIVWRVIGPRLPEGLASQDTDLGELRIFGLPESSGTSALLVEASDAHGRTARQPLVLVVSERGVKSGGEPASDEGGCRCVSTAATPELSLALALSALAWARLRRRDEN